MRLLKNEISWMMGVEKKLHYVLRRHNIVTEITAEMVVDSMSYYQITIKTKSCIDDKLFVFLEGK